MSFHFIRISLLLIFPIIEYTKSVFVCYEVSLWMMLFAASVVIVGSFIRILFIIIVVSFCKLTLYLILILLIDRNIELSIQFEFFCIHNKLCSINIVLHLLYQNCFSSFFAFDFKYQWEFAFPTRIFLLHGEIGKFERFEMT